MKKILYLHGFGSSGASGTVTLLRREFWNVDAAHRATVVAPDIPVDPAVAMPFLEELAYDEMPDLVVGTSMGGMYAQQLRGFTRVCINPSFTISHKYDVLYVGRHKWLNRRKDGETEFHVTKETVAHYREMEERQFDGVTDDDRMLCHGLFGDGDEMGPEWRQLFELHYPGMSHVFSGGHRMNAQVVMHVLLPYVRRLGVV